VGFSGLDMRFPLSVRTGKGNQRAGESCREKPINSSWKNGLPGEHPPWETSHYPRHWLYCLGPKAPICGPEGTSGLLIFGWNGGTNARMWELISIFPGDFAPGMFHGPLADGKEFGFTPGSPDNFRDQTTGTGRFPCLPANGPIFLRNIMMKLDPWENGGRERKKERGGGLYGNKGFYWPGDPKGEDSNLGAIRPTGAGPPTCWR